MTTQLLTPIQIKLQIESWVAATWGEYLSLVSDPSHAKAKCYYHNGYMRVEKMPVSSNHALDNGIIYFAVNRLS
jgi:hypothetical protein